MAVLIGASGGVGKPMTGDLLLKRKKITSCINKQ